MSAIHASAVMCDGAGVLIRGPSGSGKSSLALALLREMVLRRRFGRLIADDGVDLSSAGGRLIARSPTTIFGRIERRGLGILHVPALPAGVIRLVVDLGVDAPRLPAAGDLSTEIMGITLPRLGLPARECGISSDMICERLALEPLHDGEYLLNSGPVW